MDTLAHEPMQECIASMKVCMCGQVVISAKVVAGLSVGIRRDDDWLSH